MHEDGGYADEVSEQLDGLTGRLASMCHLAGDAVRAASEALVLADLPLAEQVFDLNEQIEELRGPCEDLAMALLALQGPGPVISVVWSPVSTL